MDMESYLIFLTASFLLWITPGQDTIYILARSVSQGRGAGFASALGVGTGALFHAILAIAGISLIILTSPTLFLVVKTIGGLYLIYLGAKAFLVKSKNEGSLPFEKQGLIKIFFQGAITNILNPKVALFFIAFFPQFVNSEAHLSSIALLGFTFVLGGSIWCLAVAYFSSSVSILFGQSNIVKNWLNKISGTIYIALGFNILRAKV